MAKLVLTTEEQLYSPRPVYQEAFFFPNEKNVDKLISYLNMAKKTLKVCVFNITHDKLANAIDAAW